MLDLQRECFLQLQCTDVQTCNVLNAKTTIKQNSEEYVLIAWMDMKLTNKDVEKVVAMEGKT